MKLKSIVISLAMVALLAAGGFYGKKYFQENYLLLTKAEVIQVATAMNNMEEAIYATRLELHKCKKGTDI